MRREGCPVDVLGGLLEKVNQVRAYLCKDTKSPFAQI